jgi:hypothetical protein
MTKLNCIGFGCALLVCVTVPLVCLPLSQWAMVSPNGNMFFASLTYLCVLLAVLAIPLFFVALIGLCFRRFRSFSAISALCSGVYLIAYFVSPQMGDEIRMKAFHRLAERSKPLVDAIRAYEEKHGRPPDSLDALVPELIPSVPTTGMGAYPKYRYSVVTNADYDGNPWVITIFTPSGGINFDQFMYWPLTNYPAKGYGGWIERVGDWAYVHE